MKFSGNNDDEGTINHRLLGWNYVGNEAKNLSLYYSFIIWDAKDISHLERQLPVKGASGHEVDGGHSQPSSISNSMIDSTHGSSRKQAELNLIVNQSKHSQQMSSYYSAKRDNECRESQTKDRALKLNAMQTNLAFIKDLMNNENDSTTLQSLKEQYNKSLVDYMKYVNE